MFDKDHMHISVLAFLRRMIGLIFFPVKTWKQVSREPKSGKQVFTGYALPLLFISGFADFFYHLYMPDIEAERYSWAVAAFIFSVIGDAFSITISAWLLALLGQNFRLNASYSVLLKIVSYSITAFALVSTMVKFIPKASILYILGFYSFYILFQGLNTFFTFPEDKKTAFVFISFLLIVVVFSITGILINVGASFLFLREELFF